MIEFASSRGNFVFCDRSRVKVAAPAQAFRRVLVLFIKEIAVRTTGVVSSRVGLDRLAHYNNALTPALSHPFLVGGKCLCLHSQSLPGSPATIYQLLNDIKFGRILSFVFVVYDTSSVL